MAVADDGTEDCEKDHVSCHGDFFNILDATISTFFSTPELPPPTVSATILNNTDKPDEPLMKVILSIYGAGRERVICHGTEISFPMAGQRVDLRRC